MATWKGQEVTMVSVAVPQNTYAVVQKLAQIGGKPVDEVIVALVHGGINDMVTTQGITPGELDTAASIARMRARMGESWQRYFDGAANR